MPDQFLDVAVAVIERQGLYLITQRMPQDSFGGSWEFPGGKANPGEGMEECLIREIREELGLSIAVNVKLAEVEHHYPHRSIRLHCYRCRILEGEPQTIECAAWRWVVPEELSQFQFPPASSPLIAQLQKFGHGEPVEP